MKKKKRLGKHSDFEKLFGRKLPGDKRPLFSKNMYPWLVKHRKEVIAKANNRPRKNGRIPETS